MVNIGGHQQGQRYIAPHIGGFIGPLPKLGSVSRNLIVFAKQPAYRTHPHITQILGPAPPGAPVSATLLIRAKQPRYPTKPHVQPWIGPYPTLGAVSKNRLVVTHYPRYPTHAQLNAQWVYQVPQPTPATVAKQAATLLIFGV